MMRDSYCLPAYLRFLPVVGALMFSASLWAQEPEAEQPHPVELSEDESVEDIEASQAIPATDAETSAESTASERAADQPSQKAQTSAKPEQAARVAPNVDLKEVTPAPEPQTSAEEAGETPQDTSTAVDSETTDPTSEPSAVPSQESAPSTSSRPEPENSETAEPAVEASQPAPQAKPLVILGSEVRPGTSTRLAWTPDTSMAGLNQPTPVLVVNGAQPGPNMCLTGAVHGDELNGIEIIRRVMYDVQAEELSGRLIGVPIVNVQGFQRGSRYLPDRRDLNRNFPGNPDGSLASRIAYSLFNDVIKHCDMLVDIHTGSLKRSNLAQLRADMHNNDVARFTEGFDQMAVVHSEGTPGMLRTAATNHGIVTVTMEAGESLRIQENQIKAGVNSINSLLEKQGMISRLFVWGKPEPVYYNSSWIRVNHGGILVSDVDLGQEVVAGEVLGIVTDPITNAQHPIKAHQDGRVIGMAVDQVVMAGFAAYHMGTEARGPEQGPEED